MVKPNSISEEMMYNTIRLETAEGSGTGSFFNFQIDKKTIPILITNRHVVNNKTHEKVKFFLHLQDEHGNPDSNIGIEYDTDWIFHDDKDLCFCFVWPLFKSIKNQYNKQVFYIANNETIIPTQKTLDDLTAIEELTMVGYPIGLWDRINNFPIFRKGFTACHPSIDFNDKGIGIADIACFPGSSGSPMYILNEGGYRDKRGNLFVGQSRIFLIGFLCAGPTYSAEGNLFIKSIPTQQKVMSATSLMTNLGYYIKSEAVLSFRQKIIDIINTQNNK